MLIQPKIPGTMPKARDFGWVWKAPSSAHFHIQRRTNGQCMVILNHALLRGLRAEMIAWWFQNFTQLKVTLENVPSYENLQVPAYLLWHPSDHFDAALEGPTGPTGEPIPGKTRIRIQEAMQYDKYAWKYPVNTALTIFYAGDDGWAMGRVLPCFGPVMILRIHFKDVVDSGVHRGVHYHYEVVIGVSGHDPISRLINRRVTGAFGPEFFQAWRTHNVTEVGVFENFLPSLFAQRADGQSLRYARATNQMNGSVLQQSAFDFDLFQQRISAFAETEDPYEVQAFTKGSFL